MCYALHLAMPNFLSYQFFFYNSFHGLFLQHTMSDFKMPSTAELPLNENGNLSIEIRQNQLGFLHFDKILQDFDRDSDEDEYYPELSNDSFFQHNQPPHLLLSIVSPEGAGQPLVTTNLTSSRPMGVPSFQDMRGNSIGKAFFHPIRPLLGGCCCCCCCYWVGVVLCCLTALQQLLLLLLDILYLTMLYCSVIKQLWPWTCFVDIGSGKRFYHNELSDSYQFEAPEEMLRLENKVPLHCSVSLLVNSYE